jgi:hypothetical protein
MASTAKQAQGTALYIAGTPGSALSITAVTKATGAVVTATNTLAVGDVVVFGSVTGMPEINGRIGIVTAATGSQFTTNIDSSGFANAGTTGTATPQTWTKISNLKDWNGFEGTVSEIDTTNLDSLGKEFQPGLEDFGSVTCTVDLDGADAGQIAAQKAKSAAANTYFRLYYPKAAVYRAFAGFVKKFGEQGQVDGVIKSMCEFRASGRVSRSEVVN